MSTIRGLENGTRSAGPLTLAKLAEALECPQMEDHQAGVGVWLPDPLPDLFRSSDFPHQARYKIV